METGAMAVWVQNVARHGSCRCTEEPGRGVARRSAMHPQRFLRDQFHAYRMWILERRLPQAPTALVVPAGIELTFLQRHARRDWACARAGDHDWPQYRVALENEHDLIVARRGTEM